MSIRAVIFDLGNTLWFEAATPDFEALYREAASKTEPLLAEWGGPQSVALEIVEEVWRRMTAGYDRVSSGDTMEEPNLVAHVREVVAHHGVQIDAGEAYRWITASYLRVEQFNWQLYPDAIDVLRALHELGVLIGINTNRPHKAELLHTALESYGLAPYVDASVCSADTGFVKPHPSTFERVLRDLGVETGEAVMVGDSCSADMRGGKSLGMTTAWKLNGRYDVGVCADADYAIHDLTELLSLPFLPRRARSVATTESLFPHEDGNAERY